MFSVIVHPEKAESEIQKNFCLLLLKRVIYNVDVRFQRPSYFVCEIGTECSPAERFYNREYSWREPVGNRNMRRLKSKI